MVFVSFSQTPGEFGDNTLCTNPAWHTALLAFKWLGLPFEVQHDDVRASPHICCQFLSCLRFFVCRCDAPVNFCSWNESNEPVVCDLDDVAQAILISNAVGCEVQNVSVVAAVVSGAPWRRQYQVEHPRTIS